jgi:UDP-N-acetylmuramate dehydrogenase
MDKYKLLIDTFGKESFKAGEMIKNHSVLNVGGPAELFFIAFSVRVLTQIILMCRKLKIPFLLLGTGSKIMISDNGFDGLVIKNRTQHIGTISVKGKVSRSGLGVEEAFVEVESGVSISKFCEYLKKENLSYIEFSDCQGSIGGCIFIYEILQRRAKSIKVLAYGEIENISSSNLRIDEHIVLSVVFKIKAANKL